LLSPQRIPIVETERLTLRGHRLDDYAASCAMWADPNVVRYISGNPSSAQQTWMRVLSYAGHWSLMGFGYWVAEETGSQKFVGEVGFADFKRALDPSLRGIPEIGWALASDMQGRGFATEAVRAAVNWSDRNRQWPRTVCVINAENIGSIRVASKCGYAEVARLELNGAPTIVFARDVVSRT
jgi:RimJ/RimL family protein N-acetyltransferase